MNTEFNLWAKILVYLYQHKDMKVTSLSICKSIGTTTAAVYLNIRLLMDKGLLTVSKKGRTNNYLLTVKGEKVAGFLEQAGVLLSKNGT